MAKHSYNLHLKGYVGGWDFDADYVDFVLAKNAGSEVHVLIDSLGGSLAKALSIVAAFRNHGNVHVHYVGMNASAATIASLGAKHVTIDSSAMYLVHKCSMEFFQWASANSDKLTSIIQEAKKMKMNLDKMDANVAEMYAKKCKRPVEDLLALMKKGGWLSAKEALDWGFVDEITEYDDDVAPVINDIVAAEMSAAGIPIPIGFSQQQPSSNMMVRFFDALANVFRIPSSTPNSKDPMTIETNLPENQAQQVSTLGNAAENTSADSVSAEVHSSAIAAKDKEIADLKAEIEALKKAPGDSTSHIVDNKTTGEKSENPDSPEAFFNTRQRAQALYDMLPH